MGITLIHRLLPKMQIFVVVSRHGGIQQGIWEARVAGAGGSEWGIKILGGASVASGAASAGD